MSFRLQALQTSEFSKNSEVLRRVGQNANPMLVSSNPAGPTFADPSEPCSGGFV